jgi:AmmeMemoRadiSam system protein A
VTAIADPTGRAALALAREAVERYIRTGSVPDPPPDVLPELRQPAGAFVTLRVRGRLRGCVGTVTPARADVAREIVASAVAAACTDPRFPAVRADELAALEYEVDIVEGLESAKDPTELEPRLYGVLVEAEGRRGVLLPDLPGVDTAEQQVAIAVSKAGLPPEARVQLHRFRVRRFRESC